MKRVCVIACVLFNLFLSLNAQTGTDCGNAISLTMDGVSRNYATSSASIKTLSAALFVLKEK